MSEFVHDEFKCTPTDDEPSEPEHDALLWRGTSIDLG